MNLRSFVSVFTFAAMGAVAMAQQPSMPPDTNGFLSRAVIYHSPQGDMLLRASFLFPRLDPHYVVFPMFIRTSRYQVVESEGRLAIAESMPTLAVQGFGPGTDWTLVRMVTKKGLEVLRIVSHSPWGDGFFSDQPFSHEDIVPVTQSASGDIYNLRPTVALQPGGYALCGWMGVDQGGAGQVCYDFEITGGA